MAMLRHLAVLTLALALANAPGRAGAEENSRPHGANFKSFLHALWPDAQANGITRATFDLAFAGLAPDPRVIAATRGQAEYGKPIGAYIAALASKARIDAGARKAAEWAAILDTVEQKFGVDRAIVLAIWGIESSYGGDKDRWDVIRSLATLAEARYRDPYFRNELLAALTILQEGHVAREQMRGSWAGALGQPQFMPSNFFAYAVDFSGDGRRDIWANVPDVLASTAHYLQKHGWQAGAPWGFEVVVPAGFDYRRSRGSYRDWAGLGLLRADGGTFPAAGDATLFFPSGASGPAFLASGNFVAIKRYNNSDAYALAVAHLADRLRGLGAIRAAWPRDDRQLSRAQRIALQRKLAELGYKVMDFEGRIDFDLRDAIRDVQAKFGMLPDGHPTAALLDRLGARPR